MGAYVCRSILMEGQRSRTLLVINVNAIAVREHQRARLLVRGQTGVEMQMVGDITPGGGAGLLRQCESSGKRWRGMTYGQVVIGPVHGASIGVGGLRAALGAARAPCRRPTTADG